MSGQGGLASEEVALSPAGPASSPTAATKKLQDGNSTEKKEAITDKEEEEEEEEEDMEEEEEVISSAHLEPSTLPWPGDKDKKPQTVNDDGGGSEKRVSEPEETDLEKNREGQDLPEELREGGRKSKARWRESMPEGERWRDDEIEVQKENGTEGGSLADDEDEEEDDEGEETHWMSEKPAPGFTPQVTIVRPSGKELPEESRIYSERVEKEVVQMEPNSAAQFYPEWTGEDDKYYLRTLLHGERLKLGLATLAAGVVFPLLVWGGYALLPFDPPLVQSGPLRVVYTLRCSFFGIIPILLGMVVLGAARLRYSVLKPLIETKQLDREVAVHWHFINESLALFLFFFLQLAVMATYISQDLLKLVPLLTIVFVFGRLIYWLCVALGSSSIRAFGFGFSFLPILVMLGANLYFVCSAVGPQAIFDVEPPTTAPPPMKRWWG